MLSAVYVRSAQRQWLANNSFNAKFKVGAYAELYPWTVCGTFMYAFACTTRQNTEMSTEKWQFKFADFGTKQDKSTRVLLASLLYS